MRTGEGLQEGETIGGVAIREIRPEDSEAAAQLSGELGYPASNGVMKRRIEDMRNLADHAVFVACMGDRVVGWIDVGIMRHLQSGAFGEICGFVVSETCRSRGVGRILLAYAERWVLDRGISRIVVRSRIARDDAHRFYEREGYTKVKISAVFSKVLEG
jgi:GNAT superfamily N-acetyltransferase